MKITIASVLAALALLLAPTASQAFYVDNSGNVGIDTTSPQAPLDVSGGMYSRLVSTSGSSTPTINWNAGNVQQLTLNANTTASFANGQSGGWYNLILKQDGTGGHTFAWPNGVKWPLGDAPTLTTSPNAIDLINFIYDGAEYLGFDFLDYQTPTLPGIAFDNAATSSASSFSYTNGGNLLVACVYTVSGSSPSITYDGVSMTQIASIPFPGSGYAGVTMFDLVNPSIGSNTVSVSGSSADGVALASYTGANTSVQPDATSTDTFSGGSSHTVSFSTNTNNDWVTVCHTNGNNTVDAGSVTNGVIRQTFDGVGPDPAGIVFDSNAPITPAGTFNSTISWTGIGGGGDVMAAFSPQ